MEFMISAVFRPQDQAEIVSRIPQEQAHIRALHKQGIIKEIYISSDFTHVWIVMQGESQEQIQQNLQTLPLYSYMQVEIAALSQM
ncbi:MAG: hypothetical protein NVS2B12_26880 [Ktedonobacteraceae bacterium]